MKSLIEKYNDPKCPGLVNYLNLHHDILAVHNHVKREAAPGDYSNEKSVDMVSLFVSMIVLH